MSNDDSTFGTTVRRLREEKKIGLRKFAQMVGMSPTYLSKVERDEFAPPAEDKVRAIADALGQDADELLALAGRVSAELADIIVREIAVADPEPANIAALKFRLGQVRATNRACS